MADLDTICNRMAGSLVPLRDTATDLIDQVSPFLLDSPTPRMLMVAGVDDVTYLDFGDGVEWTILVSAALGLLTDQASQKTLRRLLAPSGGDSIVAALEADQSLTTKLNNDGTVSTGQSAAADSIAFSEYRGQISPVLADGSQILLATWAFEVIA